MHLKITKSRYKGKMYRYATLVQGYRKGNYVSQRVIKSLGSIKCKEDEEKYKRVIENIKNEKEVVSLNQINEEILEYGVGITVKHLWKELGIEKYLFSSKATYDLNQLVYMLITHRLHNYGNENLSEREGLRWIREESYSNLNIELHQVYRGIKILLSKKEKIEKHLFDLLHKKGNEIVFYDLTSSYVEGIYEDSELVDYGYNRDKKIGKKQIVLGLLLSDSLPLAHEVWEGNTADKSTLKEAVKQIKIIGIKKFIFVADRGLITKDNLEWLENQKLEYIIATKRRKETLIKKLMNESIDKEVKKVHEEKIDKSNSRTYYLCYNKEVAKQQIRELKELKNKLMKKIEAIKDPTEHKVLEILGKAKKLFDLSFENGFKYSINKENYKYEKKIAGKYILVTNNKELSKQDILKTYKQLMEIERCFRQLKHFEDMRPIFHKTDDGIKAHVFIAILTLLIEKIINKKVSNMTTRKVITEMKKLKIGKVNEIYVRTELSNIQKKILAKLEIEEPQKVIS